MALQIGITGGIGSGKSIVCQIFKCLGIPVYDADSRAKYLMTTDGILLTQIKKEFGLLSFHSDGSLNRAYLSSLVFDDPDKLATLNSLVHPRVGEDYARWVEEHSTSDYVVKEAALLFETGGDKNLNAVVVVYAPETLRMKRVLKRDPQRSEDQVQSIMKRQLGDDERLKRANYVVQNDESRLLIPQVLELHDTFMSIT